MLLVFATNLRPSTLVDEAFLRRIHYKVLAESPTVEEFRGIFESCCLERGRRLRRGLVDGHAERLLSSLAESRCAAATRAT